MTLSIVLTPATTITTTTPSILLDILRPSQVDCREGAEGWCLARSWVEIRCPPPVLIPLHPINRRRCVYFQTCAGPYCTKVVGDPTQNVVLHHLPFSANSSCASQSLPTAHSNGLPGFFSRPPSAQFSLPAAALLKNKNTGGKFGEGFRWLKQ